MLISLKKNNTKALEYYQSGNCMNDCEHYDNCSDYIYSKGYNKAIEDVKNLITERLKKDCNMASCDDCEECCEVSALMWIDKRLNKL